MTDEEKINDLKNKISFALKDATLQQGFEIICERISKLKKENKICEEIIIGEQQEINELKKKIEEMQNSVREVLADPDVEVGMIMKCVGLTWISKDKIKEMNKVNAELKRDKTELVNSVIELKTKITKLENLIKKMKNNQKTAYVKGMRHLAKAIKKYDRDEGSYTDFLEHTVDLVLKRELEK